MTDSSSSSAVMGKRPPAGIAAAEQRGDAVRHRPDMQAHHQGGRPLAGGQHGHQGVGRGAQHAEGAIGRGAQIGIEVGRQARFEHRGIVGGLGAREGEIGPADIVEGGERIGLAAGPAGREHRLEALEALARHVGQQRLAIAEVTVGRRRADARRTRGVGEGEAGRALFLDQLARGLDQRLAQIAVVIGALGSTFPTHVKGVYIERVAASTRAMSAVAA